MLSVAPGAAAVAAQGGGPAAPLVSARIHGLTLGQVQRLRAAGVDVVRVHEPAAGAATLAGTLIADVVVARDRVPALRGAGYDIRLPP